MLFPFEFERMDEVNPEILFSFSTSALSEHPENAGANEIASRVVLRNRPSDYPPPLTRFVRDLCSDSDRDNCHPGCRALVRSFVWSGFEMFPTPARLRLCSVAIQWIRFRLLQILRL